MTDTITLELAQRGVLMLPQALRDQYHLEPGDNLTLLDLGGVFVLSPRRSEIDSIANSLKQELASAGETLESMLLTIREIRDAAAG